jgi:hypothetical protein
MVQCNQEKQPLYDSDNEGTHATHLHHTEKACQESKQAIEDHFNIDVKIVKAGATTLALRST